MNEKQMTLTNANNVMSNPNRMILLCSLTHDNIEEHKISARVYKLTWRSSEKCLRIAYTQLQHECVYVCVNILRWRERSIDLVMGENCVAIRKETLN